MVGHAGADDHPLALVLKLGVVGGEVAGVGGRRGALLVGDHKVAGVCLDLIDGCLLVLLKSNKRLTGHDYDCLVKHNYHIGFIFDLIC